MKCRPAAPHPRHLAATVPPQELSRPDHCPTLGRLPTGKGFAGKRVLPHGTCQAGSLRSSPELREREAEGKRAEKEQRLKSSIRSHDWQMQANTRCEERSERRNRQNWWGFVSYDCCAGRTASRCRHLMLQHRFGAGRIGGAHPSAHSACKVRPLAVRQSAGLPQRLVDVRRAAWGTRGPCATPAAAAAAAGHSAWCTGRRGSPCSQLAPRSSSCFHFAQVRYGNATMMMIPSTHTIPSNHLEPWSPL